MSNLFKKNIYFCILFVILALSLFLRLYKIDVNPPSLDWDEVSIGYNAYSLLKTGADEYGNKLPLAIRSFDDYKPPVYIYLDVPSVAVLGLNEKGVRFPAALFGLISVIVIYFLVKEIFSDWEKDKKEKLALLCAFFLGVSPWHLQFSRAAFEGNVGLFFFMLGFILLLKSIKKPILSIASAISFCLSIYSYHSFLLITPIFLLISAIFFRKEILADKKYYFISFLVALIILSPVALSFMSNAGSGSRLSMVSLFSQEEILNNSIKEIELDNANNDFVGSLFHNRRIVFLQSFAKAYFDQWNPDFLFFHGDGGRQHHAVNMGMLYVWDLPFILFGIFMLFNMRTKKSLLLVLMFLLAPLPAAISTGTPHPVRAIAMVPGFSIFVSLGIYFLFFDQNKVRNKIALVIVTLLFVINFSYYLHQYYIHTPIEYGDFWQYGNKEAVSTAKELEEKYDKIIYTYTYDQPYIYYLFYNKVDPIWYQKNWDFLKTGKTERMRRIIGKYEFRNINWNFDSKLKNALLIGSPLEIPGNARNIIKTIYFPNGSVAFRIVGT